MSPSVPGGRDRCSDWTVQDTKLHCTWTHTICKHTGSGLTKEKIPVLKGQNKSVRCIYYKSAVLPFVLAC